MSNPGGDSTGGATGGGTTRALDDLAAVAAATAAVVVPQELATLPDSLVGLARTVFGAAACSLAFVDEATDELVYLAASGEGAERIVGVRLPVDRGFGGWVAQSGQPIAVSEPARDQRFARDVAEFTGYVPSGLLVVPVESRGRVVGVFTVLDRYAGRPGADRDLELAAGFAEQAAAGIAAREAFTGVATTLLTGLAAAARDRVELAAALRARTGPGDDGLSEVAALLADLHRAGPAERRLAVRLVSDVLDYARAGRTSS